MAAAGPSMEGRARPTVGNWPYAAGRKPALNAAKVKLLWLTCNISVIRIS